MPVLQDITGSLISEHIRRAVHEVFSTMLAREAEFVAGGERVAGQAVVPAGGPAEGLQVVGTVGFVGDINGLMYVYFAEDFASLATRHLLGMSESELLAAGAEVVNDAIGELTNMTVGSFKNGLCDAGYPCKLTIPTILRGRNLAIEPISSARRHDFLFNCAGHRVAIEILMKTGE